MNKPFETIDVRLSRIEIFMLDLKNLPKTIVQQNETEQLLTLQEAAQLLNHTVPTIYDKVSKGELPSIKQSKCLYFSLIELMGFIKKGEKSQNPKLKKKRKPKKRE